MKRDDIELVIKEFKSKAEPDDRYTSFDYCYNYFSTTDDLKKDIEKSCLVLGFYLASWGMYRGSSFILQKSIKYFEEVIEYIDSFPDKSVWKIDVDNYNEENINTIIRIYKDVKNILIKNGNSDLTLVTKVLLGVFGFVPAYDNYFCKTFREISKNQCGFRSLNSKSLNYIKEFYEANKETIDKLSLQTFTTDFQTEQKTKINYSKAKIVDMYGFQLGILNKK